MLHGGVVDNKMKVSLSCRALVICLYSGLQVYGTTNIRVMDISIIPLHISAHTQGEAKILSFFSFLDITLSFVPVITATAYAIGELGRYSESMLLYREVRRQDG